jgi:hypothetical protein
MLETFGSIDVLPIGAPDGVPEIDPSRGIGYIGISEGANNGQAFLPYAPEVRAGVLATGGTRLSEILFHQDVTGVGDDLAPFVQSQIPNVRAPDVWAGLALFQMGFDRQDPQSHAIHLYRDPLEVAGTLQKPSVMIAEGIGDNLVANNATRSLAWVAGPIPHLEPIHQRVPFLEPVSGPVSANVDAQTTAAYLQFVPLGVPGLDPSPGCEFEFEGHYCGQIAAEPQGGAFLRSAMDGGVPVIQPAP